METAQNTAEQAEGGEKAKVRMIFLYRRHRSKGELVTEWAVTDQENDGQPLDIKRAKFWTFGPIKHMKHLYTGNVYIFDAILRPDDGASVTFADGPLADQEQWKNRDDLRQWSHREYSDKVEISTRNKLAKSSDEWKAGLEPYKREYWKAAPGPVRAALLAAIITEITSGRV